MCFLVLTRWGVIQNRNSGNIDGRLTLDRLAALAVEGGHAMALELIISGLPKEKLPAVPQSGEFDNLVEWAMRKGQLRVPDIISAAAHTVTQLNLQKLGITVEGAKAIAHSLDSCPNLHTLHLGGKSCDNTRMVIE